MKPSRLVNFVTSISVWLVFLIALAFALPKEISSGCQGFASYACTNGPTCTYSCQVGGGYEPTTATEHCIDGTASACAGFCEGCPYVAESIHWDCDPGDALDICGSAPPGGTSSNCPGGDPFCCFVNDVPLTAPTDTTISWNVHLSANPADYQNQFPGVTVDVKNTLTGGCINLFPTQFIGYTAQDYYGTFNTNAAAGQTCTFKASVTSPTYFPGLEATCEASVGVQCQQPNTPTSQIGYKTSGNPTLWDTTSCSGVSGADYHNSSAPLELPANAKVLCVRSNLPSGVSSGSFNLYFRSFQKTSPPADPGVWYAIPVNPTNFPDQNVYSVLSRFNQNGVYCPRFAPAEYVKYLGAPVGPAWWQVRDIDVVAGNVGANITSNVPSTKVFGLDGTGGGYPGIPRYEGSLIPTTSSPPPNIISSKGWNAKTKTDLGTTYGYSFFKNKVPTDVSSRWTNVGADNCSPGGGPCTIGGSGGYFNSSSTAVKIRGYNWYWFDGSNYGDLIIDQPTNLTGDRKVILFVEGADVTLRKNININTDGQGFFMVIAGKKANGQKGNIIVDPGNYASVGPALEGIYFAEATFQTGTGGTNQLALRGIVAANDGVQLQRNLSNNLDDPAEYFEYAPELMTLYPNIFKVKRIRWREVAP